MIHANNSVHPLYSFGWAALLFLAANARGETAWPVVAKDDFEGGIDRWEFLDPEGWERVTHEANHVLSQHTSASKYTPPYRSPFHVALLKEPKVGDFELTAKVHSTKADYPHRDACLFFGYQDPAHFYYVHFGKSMDPFANQIFIVNGDKRKNISLTTNAGAPWDDNWHTVRVHRNVSEGTIEVFFDDLKKPSMTAKDTTFGVGRVGVGSFDDTAEWDDIELRAAE